MASQPSRNISFVSHTDMNGHADGVQIMVHRGYAYVGHGFSNGITTLDVRDAKNPKVVDFIACPPGTRALHLQTHDDLLLAVNAPSVWHMQQFQTDKAYFGGSFGSALPQAQCLVDSQKVTSQGRMLLMLDCSQAALEQEQQTQSPDGGVPGAPHVGSNGVTTVTPTPVVPVPGAPGAGTPAPG